MKTALVIGSSGLVGNHVVKILLKNNHYSQIKTVVRTSNETSHPKLEQIVFDFDKPDISKIEADDIYCCIGTTIKKAGSKEAFKKVDYEYPITIAQAAYNNGSKRFAIITAHGSNVNSKIFYNKVKGEVEHEITKIPFQTIIILRPSILLGKRKEFRLAEKIGKIVSTALIWLLPGNIKPIKASKVANMMVTEMVKEQTGRFIIESKQMQKI